MLNERIAMDTIRKQIYDLTPHDFNEVPIWQYCLDEEDIPGHDEATVRPRPDLLSADASVPGLIVKMIFTCADDTRFVGYVCVEDSRDLGYLQPHICTPFAQIGFWYGMHQPDDSDLAFAYGVLEKGKDDLFPVTYERCVPCSVPLEGQINGFHYLGTRPSGKFGLVLKKRMGEPL